jgi:hypothetical protein
MGTGFSALIQENVKSIFSATNTNVMGKELKTSNFTMPTPEDLITKTKADARLNISPSTTPVTGPVTGTTTGTTTGPPTTGGKSKKQSKKQSKKKQNKSKRNKSKKQ